MKFLLFGTGDYYNRYKKWFEKQEVMALLDNSMQKRHMVIDGFRVLTPEEGIKLDYDSIVILSFYVKQMKQQLISLGVKPDRIYHFYDLHSLIAPEAVRRPLQYFPDARDVVECMQPGVPKILFLSHDLTLGGPCIALYHAARLLKKQGYVVVFGSMLDGPLKIKLMENDISVVVDENLQISTMKETEWVSSFSLIICNTMNFHIFLSERDTRIPVIWWLHDASFFYDGVNKNTMEKIAPDNLTVVSVGPVPADAIGKYLPHLDCGELLYGVGDMGRDEGIIREDNEVRFITIGFLEDIKGQDVLVQAVRKLSSDVRNQCSFFIVGHDKTLFGERIHKESTGIGKIYFTGSVDRQEIHRLLSEADVLICPSRQDAMPTVAAEAMMHSVPSIVSDVTGTAAYIHDGEDGFVFPSGDAQALAERIEWCIANKAELQSMGKKARMLYEKYFSMPAFEKRFMEVICEALRK